MKQQKLTGYVPNYPKRFFRDAALTAAALVAMGGIVGCQQAKAPEELRTEGMVAIPEPTEQVLALGGDVAEPEPTKAPSFLSKLKLPLPTEAPLVTEGVVAVPEPTEEPLVLEGEVAIWEPEITDAAPQH